MPATEPPAADPLAGAPRAVRESLETVCASSDFLRQAVAHRPQLVAQLISSGALTPEPLAAPAAYFRGGAPIWPADVLPPETHVMAELRRWRQRELVRIAWRDLAGWATLGETLGELSMFADTAIETAYRYVWQRLAAAHGEPRSEQGVVQSLVVVAMGKLGGRELNFSSDVDLIFLYPEPGETSGAAAIANEQFFTRAGQGLIRLLDARTPDGMVFRVDMRLRPFGASGPLVASFAALEDYLESQGRDWERYAWVKARPVTASERYVELYAAAIRPFVYRRYLDFGVFQSLREMKALIERQVARAELESDVKLGAGGIREIEFVVQALQLIRGGRDTRLQTSSLLDALALLDGHKLLSPQAVVELRAAYAFLRRLENRLQMLADERVHRLPDDPVQRKRLAIAMGAADGSELAAELERHRACVSRHFRAVVFAAAASDSHALINLEPQGSDSASEADARSLLERLQEAGFADEAPQAARMLTELRESALLRKLDEVGRKRLQALLAPLLARVATSPGPLAVLRRVLRILEAIGPRSVYFSLLNESAVARERLTEIAAHGDFLVDQIAAYPLLLDELVDDRVLTHSPNRAELASQLAIAMGQVAHDDLERQVEALKHFQRAATFHVAVADLSGRLPVMRVSDRLTEIAELILERTMALAWQQTTAQFGVPRCGEGAARTAAELCALGYGKLGGFELGYGSDLDLVFLYDASGGLEQTDGPRPIDNQQFFARVVQRIVHLLTLHSGAGRLYEVDVRLRPSGKAGLLVTSLNAFADYQKHSAWTWEHQALLHARAVGGTPRLRAAVEALRMDVLRHHVRRESLRREVRTMRGRMRRELSKARSGEFDLKQDAGGIADIEFLAQYWALRWAGEHPEVARFSDTIRELESVASAALVPQETVDVLTDAYRAYRARAHHLSLEQREPRVPAGEFAAQRAAVRAIWTATMDG